MIILYILAIFLILCLLAFIFCYCMDKDFTKKNKNKKTIKFRNLEEFFLNCIFFSFSIFTVLFIIITAYKTL